MAICSSGNLTCIDGQKWTRSCPEPNGVIKISWNEMKQPTHLNHLRLKGVGLNDGRDGGGRCEDGAGHRDDRLRAQDEAAALR